MILHPRPDLLQSLQKCSYHFYEKNCDNVKFHPAGLDAAFTNWLIKEYHIFASWPFEQITAFDNEYALLFKLTWA